jgi:hypothetical protein
VNRLSLALSVGLSAMDACWLAAWAALIGAWTDPAHPHALVSAPSVLALVLVGALSTQALGRRIANKRRMQVAVAGLGLVMVVVVVRVDQYAGSSGVEWLASLVRAIADVFGQGGAPALAFAFGLFVWWRGVRQGSQTASFAEAESEFHWGIGLLVAFALLVALTTRPSALPALQAQTTPLIVGFFFVSLLTLALGRLESLRTRTRALPVNTQWLGVLVAVAGMVILLALLVGQVLSFDLLFAATRPIFDVLGQVLMLALYVLVIPLAFVVEWLIYLLLNLLRANAGQPPPQPLQPADINSRLQSLASINLPPELLTALKAAGAAVVLAVVLVIVARTASRWRSSGADADATDEQRDSLWEPGRLKRMLLAWLGRLLLRFRRRSAAAPAAETAVGAEAAGATQLQSIRALYRQVLRLGEAAGASRGLATTPLEHLGPLQRSLEPADDLARLTEAYLSVRYADLQPTPAEAAAAREQVDRLHPRPLPPDEADAEP